MPAAIPLIRGFALLPTLHWLADEGVSIERALAKVDLSLSPITHPFRPIPLAHAAALLRNAAREHGPDLPCRIVSKTSSLEVAMLGRVALGARTPGEALARIVAALPYYCSHEQVSFERKARPICRAGVLRPQVRPRDEAHPPAVRRGHDRSHTQHGGRSCASICQARNSSASRAQSGAPSALVRRPCGRSGITRDHGRDRGPGHGARLQQGGERSSQSQGARTAGLRCAAVRPSRIR